MLNLYSYFLYKLKSEQNRSFLQGDRIVPHRRDREAAASRRLPAVLSRTRPATTCG
jgi:hypothetical protein